MACPAVAVDQFGSRIIIPHLVLIDLVNTGYPHHRAPNSLVCIYDGDHRLDFFHLSMDYRNDQGATRQRGAARYRGRLGRKTPILVNKLLF